MRTNFVMWSLTNIQFYLIGKQTQDFTAIVQANTCHHCISIYI